MALSRALAVTVLVLFATAPVWGAEGIEVGQVYGALKERPAERDRNAYLKTTAGTVITGLGVLEDMTPRKFYDTSVPDSDPFVALIRVDHTRKVVCGLSKDVLDTLGWLKEGSTVAFSGKLVDAQDWGENVTLYMGNCTLSRR